MAKQAGRKRAPHSTPRVVVAAFADLPAWEALLDAFHVPHALARRGFFCHLTEHPSTVFEQHSERGKLAATAVDAAVALVGAVVEGCRWHLTMSLGRHDVGAVELDIGFHLDLDAPTLVGAFEKDGFQVVGLEACGEDVLASTAAGMDGKAIWPFVTALLERGIAIGPVLESLASCEPPRPPEKVLDAIAASLAPTDIQGYRAILRQLDDDGVERALPVIERLCNVARTKRRVTGLPAQLAVLLSAFDGLPVLGVMSAAEIAKVAARESKAPRRRWEFLSERVRGDRAWRSQWTPFSTASGRLLCIDDDPHTRGTKGQIIGVGRKPPELHHEASSLEDWLWRKLAELTPAAAVARRARGGARVRASRATARTP